MKRTRFTDEQIIGILAERFGPASKIGTEVPDWIEYFMDTECPERPRTRPGAVCWGKVRSMLEELRAGHE